MADTLSSKNYQTLLTVRDKSFNAAAISQYHLSIYVSDTLFKVSCVNPTTTQCLFLEAYRLSDGQGEERLQAIEQLYQDHHLLGSGNWLAATLCSGNQQYTLLPKQFLQESAVADYLNFTCPIGPNTPKHFTHSSLNLTVAFAIDPLLLNFFQKIYAQTRLNIIHQASSLIEGTVTSLRSSRPKLLSTTLVFVEANHLHIIIIQRNKLLYYNRFEYTNSNEFLSYILNVMHILQLNPSLHEVILAGSINKSSLSYRKARNYIRKLSLMDKPPYLKFRRVFGRAIITPHLDVLSTHLCY